MISDELLEINAFQTQEEVNALRELEGTTAWYEILSIMALIRQFGMYLVLITLWIHLQQVGKLHSVT